MLNGFNRHSAFVSHVYMAVAFFTEESFVSELARSGCHVRMVVRLGYPTKPSALREITKNKNVDVRYYSNHSFHPKLYIFGDRVAFVGSANLTRSALLTNQEIVVSIEPDDPRFDELSSLFSAYWNEAGVLTPAILDSYETIFRKHRNAIQDVLQIDDEVHELIGTSAFSNIKRGDSKKSKENLFFENYQKTFQEAVSAFESIKDVYKKIGKRKSNSEVMPLRLEIDSFFSFVRDTYATHEVWRDQPIGWDDLRKALLKSHVEEWLVTDWPHYDNTISRKNYPLIIKVFQSPESINQASQDEMIDALVVLHSFHDRLRFYKGGLETLIKEFIRNNDFKKVKSSLIHLLYDEGNIVKRMSDLIYDADYKLNEFGQANVQELVGWINKEDLPVINGRTTKIIRYYGFDVRQL